ncbi:MAG: YARHG domain-containing protein [Paludibacteraceae bacterium]|nr:YARHG domain-containing protein [Paludibacteraceae bacterium]
MKKVLLACALLLVGMAWANDSEYYTSGNQLVPLRQTTIRVTKEVLKIDLRDDGTAFVDVQYEFTNPENEAKTILMGFEAAPPYPDGFRMLNNMKHPYIQNFTVEMNGKRLRYNNAISRNGKFKPMNVSGMSLDMGGMQRTSQIGTNNEGQNRIEDFSFVYYFNATFEPGINKIHHTYSYRMTESVNWLYSLDYKLSPAARWANKQIDDFTLIVSANKTAKHFNIPRQCVNNVRPEVVHGAGKVRAATQFDGDMKRNVWEISLRKGAVSFHIKNFKPSARHELEIQSMTYCFGGYGGNDRLAHSYDRGEHGSAFLHCISKGGYSDEFVQLIIRNLPYASRGRVFKTKGLQKFFESCWWYMPDPRYNSNTKDFTKTDWEYVNYKYNKNLNQR